MKCCWLFRFNVVFNNFSVITRRCLVATGSSMLTFIVLPHWSIKPQTLDMIQQLVTLSRQWVDQSYLYPVSLSAKQGAASTIFNNFGMLRPGIEPVTSRSPKLTTNWATGAGHNTKCRNFHISRWGRIGFCWFIFNWILCPKFLGSVYNYWSVFIDISRSFRIAACTDTHSKETMNCLGNFIGNGKQNYNLAPSLNANWKLTETFTENLLKRKKRKKEIHTVYH